MNKISNEIMNRYLDGELDYEERKAAEKLLTNSSKDKKEYLLLHRLDKNLRKMKSKRISQNFTSDLMDKLSVRTVRNRKQSRFILYIIASLLFPLLVLTGTVIYNIFSNYNFNTLDFPIINSINNIISIWYVKFSSYFPIIPLSVLWISFTFILSIAIYFLLDELYRSRYYLYKIR